MEGSASECIFDEHQEFPDDTFDAADLSCDCVVFLLRYHYFNHRVCGDYLWAYIMLRCFKPYLPEEDLHAHDESVLLHEVDKDLDEESGDTDNDAEQTVDDAPANDTETDAADESAEE